MINTPLVSVIIPIYKVEQYLHPCVNSVLGQTYNNLEIILVDDGSPDNCPTICDEYAQKDNRIKVIHKKNGGLSDARNAGIEVATGEYLCFVDSDDMVHNRMIELLMMSIIYKKDIDISCVEYTSFTNDEELKELNTINESFIVVDKYKYFKSKWAVSAWGKIYKKNLFNDIRFPIKKFHEDTFTTYKLCYKANMISYNDSCLYFYRVREGSIMRTPNAKRLNDLHQASIESIKFFKECNEESLYAQFLLIACEYYCFSFIRTNSLYVPNCTKEKKQWKSDLMNNSIKALSLKQKMKFILFTNAPKLGYFINKCYNRIKQ